jgi:(1->4)-alpha-D-glucan 1-alpha-D-glucosylmutase
MIHIPLATYRLQLNPAFGFEAAKEIVPYLAELGISDLYASPVFKARRGSLHGYDVVDPTRLNAELGTERDFEALSKELRSHDMGWLQDVVPNHMAFAPENEMLMDVLENGESSEFFRFFDVNWGHPYPSIRGRLLAPLLGRFYGDALEQGEIQIRYGADGFTIHYHDLTFPLKIETYVHLLTYGLPALRGELGGDDPDLVKLLGILYVLRTLPSGVEARERHDQIKFIKKTLWELYTNNPHIRRFIDENARTFNGVSGRPETFTLLDNLLSEQLFRLSFWKVATEEINYRRFFNINQLLSVRVEDEDVFRRTHSRIFALIDAGHVTGLRIDHIDGLYDPKQYLSRLRKRYPELYLVVEKILELGEELPPAWPVQGTTGYDFLNYVNGLFCRKDNKKRFARLYSGFIGSKARYEDIVSDKKRLIMGKHMAGDIDNLAHLLKEISSRDRFGSDITLYGLKRALVEVMAHFPVYRTYISREDATEHDYSYITWAVNEAVQSNPGLSNELRFIERFLVLDSRCCPPEAERERWTDFVMRFQQFTGPLMAKGFEDTTLYVYNRLLSLNEVGGSPDIFGVSLEEFHRFNQRRFQTWPHTLNATSTHDTKRGEDIRARLNVLSEMPEEWERSLKTWNRLNAKHKRKIGELRIPERNDEYQLYQTIVGAYPFGDDGYPGFRDRIKQYMVKAVREAKVHTAWLKPDQQYEEACLSFIEEILTPSFQNGFLEDFLPFQKRVAFYGVFNSLCQTLIKITSPGVPDFYRGTELWDLNLVDPDNRRPVDLEERRRLLGEIKARAAVDRAALVRELLRTREDGRIKLFLILMGLRARKDFREVFLSGRYRPLEVLGSHRNHCIAYARETQDVRAVTIAPRFLVSLVGEGEDPLGMDIWQDTRVPLGNGFSRTWRNVLTGEVLHARDALVVGEMIQSFPVALLVNQE